MDKNMNNDEKKNSTHHIAKSYIIQYSIILYIHISYTHIVLFFSFPFTTHTLALTHNTHIIYIYIYISTTTNTLYKPHAQKKFSVYIYFLYTELAFFFYFTQLLFYKHTKDNTIIEKETKGRKK